MEKIEFTVPEDGQIKRGAFESTITFRVLVEALVEHDKQFNCDGAGIRSGVRLQGVDWVGGETVSVRLDDIQRLSKAAEEPTAGYPMALVPAGVNASGEPLVQQVPLGGKILGPFLNALALAASPAGAAKRPAPEHHVDADN